MILPPQETERFYRIWWALLYHTNEQLHLFPNMPVSPGVRSVSDEKVFKVRQALWKVDSLLERFVTNNPAGLSRADLEIVASWRHRLTGRFFVLRHLKKYSIFLSGGEPARVYGVVGLVAPLEEVIGPYLPLLVEAVLLPYEDKIIYDSLLLPHNVTFGSGIRRNLNLSYREAQEREGVITSLAARASH